MVVTPHHAQRPGPRTAGTLGSLTGALRFGDLDQRPELASAALAAFAAASPGQHHLVCGHPSRMGQVPLAEDLRACSAVLVAASATSLHGVLAVCPYSAEQATLWGPATVDGPHSATARALVAQARAALGSAGFTSVRTLIDQRNRELRTAYLAQGFTRWKDDVVYERILGGDLPQESAVEAVLKADQGVVAQILSEAFPESDHASKGLAVRTKEGYRHYLIHDQERIAGAAAVHGAGSRVWLNLIAVGTPWRGKGWSRRLLVGVCALEARRGASVMGLEVLGDNRPAIRLYQGCGFTRSFSASVLTAPV